MTEIKIYNRNQIGGNFTVISCNGKKIMIDYGMALPGSPVEQEEFDWENDKVDAVFFTHYHGDHVGRILEIPKSVPLYMGKTARLVMLNIHKALAGVEELHDEQMQYVSLLNDKERIHEFRVGVACKKIGDIEVIPYFVDHSAYDAYMFLIITPDETILHTGDFRTHGYRGSKLFPVLERLVLPRAGGCIDSLIIEGTMMERGNEKVLKESELQQEAAKICKENKYVFLVCSSTNLDTLASFHKAALDNDMYTYCYNKYLLGQLETFTKTAGQYTDLYKFDKTYLAEPDKEFHHKYWEKPKTQEKIMREKGFLCIIKPGKKYAEWIECFADLKPKIVYALWNGYLDPKMDAYIEEWADFFAAYREREQFIELHTSGHATPETIAKVIEMVKPRKWIYPMHTGKSEEFKKLAIQKEYKKRVFMEFTKEEKEMLEAMKDSRCVCEKLKKAFYNGSLAEFRKFIIRENVKNEKKEKITALLRGNSNSIIVYYNNHKLWELSVVGEKGRVEFNFDHARYTRDWEDRFNRLVEMGFVCPQGKSDNSGTRLEAFSAMKVREREKGKKNGTIGTIYCDNEKFSKEFVEENFKIVKGLICDFFNVSKDEVVDYFRKAVKTEDEQAGIEKNRPRALIEKIWQQRLYFEYQNLQDGLFVYDLEFSQPYPEKRICDKYRTDQSTSAKTLRDKCGTNEPDMFAVRFERGKPVSLVMIEVKSTKSACKGTSGIDKHLRGMYEYSKQEIFMKNRRSDASCMIKQLCYFGLIPNAPEGYEVPEVPDNIKVERVLLLTNNYSSETKEEDGGAVAYFREHSEAVKEQAKLFDCQIWLTDNLYMDEDIKIVQE